jgi:hypothetical protein
MSHESLRRAYVRLARLILIVAPFEGARAENFDWAQPPVGCVEEIAFQKPPFPCLDLSQVRNPGTDLPAGMLNEERQLWEGERKNFLAVCRAKEVLRRDAHEPGSQSPFAVEMAWMRVFATERAEEKINAIYDSAGHFGMPPQLLIGALTQESQMANLGIAEDGGNYSCGIGQLNLSEWCRWAESESSEYKTSLGWPMEKIKAWKTAHRGVALCSTGVMPTSLVRPFYRVGVSRLKGLPTYRLVAEHLRDISYEDVEADFPVADLQTQELRYLLTRSFVDHCTHHAHGIRGKASELASLFAAWIPPALRERDTYAEGEGYARACRHQPPEGGLYKSRRYPLHPGWLLTIGIYNAGPRARDIVTHYQGINPETLNSPESWDGFSPAELVSSLYNGGRYNAQTDLIDLTKLRGDAFTMDWYRQCILQRHVSRVVEWVTLPGQPRILPPLEGGWGCKRSSFNEDGTLRESGVPPWRQVSSGLRDDAKP